MGACFNAYVLKGTKEQVTEKWNAAVELSLYEDGANYSGEIGMLGSGINFRNTEVESAEAGDNYLEENHEKWDPAMGVKVEGTDCWVVGGWCSS